MAELAERLPEGAEEVVLGRRVSAGGRTSAFVAGRAATAADLKLLGGRLLAFFGQHEHRKLTISSAQLEVLDGFAGAEHLERARALPRGAPRVRAARRRAGRAARARGLAGARSRPLPLRALRDRGGRARPRRAGRSSRPSASGCATPRACARRPAGAHAGAGRRRRGRRRRGGGAGPGRIAAAGRGRARRRPRRDRRAGRGARGRARRRRRRSCATTPRGSRPTRRALLAVEERLEAIDRLRAQARRQRRVGARPRRALPRGDRAAGGRRGARRRGRGGAGRGRGAARGAGRASSAPAAPRPPRPLRGAGRRGAGAAGDAGATLEVVLEPHPDGYGAGGRETVELRVAPNPGIEAAPLRDAASGGELSRVMLALSGLGQAAGAGHPRLRRDRRRDRRQHRPRRRRAAAGARRRAARSLCITHLPQVASLADVHFRLEKDVAGEQAIGHRRAARRRGRGRGDPPHARRRALRRGGDPPRPRAARRSLTRA